MIMDDSFDRLGLLIGSEALDRLASSSVFICGVGGVGSWAAEMLARCGIGRVVIMDMDTVKSSNINRQLPALQSTIGRLKVDVMGERLRDINPRAEVRCLPVHLEPQDAGRILEELRPDCVVDAIDERQPKIALLKACVEMGIPVVSSMGAGNKRNPELVRTVDISRTFGCPLAKQIRKNLRKHGVEKGIQVVFSPELPPEDGGLGDAEEEGSRRPVGSISFMPAIFGMHCASTAVKLMLDR